MTNQTKTAILEAVRASCEEEGIVYDDFFDSMRKNYLFDLFMDVQDVRRGGRYARETALYGVDADAVFDVFSCCAEEKAERRAYLKEHGFRHDSLAALLAQPWAEYETHESAKDGREFVLVYGYGHYTRATLYTDRAREIVIRGFSALKGGQDAHVRR